MGCCLSRQRDRPSTFNAAGVQLAAGLPAPARSSNGYRRQEDVEPAASLSSTGGAGNDTHVYIGEDDSARGCPNTTNGVTTTTNSKVDEWWAGRVGSTSEVGQVVRAPVVTGRITGTPERVRERASVSATVSPRHMTTAQLKKALRDMGVQAPEGVDRETLQRLVIENTT